MESKSERSGANNLGRDMGPPYVFKLFGNSHEKNGMKPKKRSSDCSPHLCDTFAPIVAAVYNGYLFWFCFIAAGLIL
jgi:hypothetical protein